MREHETSAPSLGDWVMVPREPTVAMCRAAIDENTTSHLTEAHRRILTSGYARVYRAMLAAAPPTTMAEAVASARAEGLKEGLERAAKACEAHAPNVSDPYMPRSGAERLDVQDEVCAMLADDIRALIPGGRAALAERGGSE